MMVVVVN